MAAISKTPSGSYRGVFTSQPIDSLVDAVNSLTANGFPGTRSLNSNNAILTVTATANTDSTIALPTNANGGALIRSISVYTTTAFTAGTDAQIEIGSAVGGAQYVALTSIKTVGLVSLTLVASAAATFANFTPGIMYIRIVQTGTATAVGQATLVVSYDVPA